MSKTSYYLAGTGEGNKLHTAVLKQIHDNQVFIVAVGYGGGGVFEEFCGKFHWSDEKDGMWESTHCFMILMSGKMKYSRVR